MLKLCGRGGLGLEALAVVVVGELAAEDHFQGDDAIEANMPRLENDAHPAAANLAQQFVVVQAAGRNGEGGCGRLRFGPKFPGELRIEGWLWRSLRERTLFGSAVGDGLLIVRLAGLGREPGSFRNRIAHRCASSLPR